ncbi:hypothetical protein [Streptosporangium sp. CA-115845]|uniref:hypothetical protein n=1 Tax=Streptosporangium sp. CA-115845 TaxID=3240071 RepID=UPI003D8F69C4
MANQKTKPEERFDQVLFSMQTKRLEIIGALTCLHPASGCLPLPTFEVPKTSQDFEKVRRDIYDNLFTKAGNRVDAWCEAFDRDGGCIHLSENQVRLAWEIIWNWYLLINVGERYTEIARRRLEFREQEKRVSRWTYKVYDGPDVQV